MRVLWSQISRPRLGGFPSISTCSNDPAAGILVRKTTTAPIRRRLTFNDAFTLLLTPVLATAFVVDTSWKEKQRRDWDKKLAEIQDEIDQIKARELRVRSSQRLRSVSGGPLCQERHYSVSATPQTDWVAADGAENELDSDPDQIEAPYWLVNNDLSTGEDENTSHSKSTNSEQVDSLDPETVESFSSEDMSAAHRYHRLIATLLAIRLLTHFHVVTKGYLKPVPDDMIEDKTGTAGFPEVKELPGLVEVRHNLDSELASLRRTYPNLDRLGTHVDMYSRRTLLHMKIISLVEDFRQQKLDRFDFVQSYAKLILGSDQVPCTRTYASMLKALGRAGHDSLAYYVTAALTKSKLPLDDNVVVHMLLSFGQARDSAQFEKFLKDAVESRNRKFNLVGKWQLYMSKYGAIPVPENLNPDILQTLVYMALRTKQVERAEVWSSFLEEMNFASSSSPHVFTSFLQAYAIARHWDAGHLWLRRCVQYASQLASISIESLSRVIFRMLDLCVACRRLPEYTTILDAAVNAGIHPPTPHPFRPKSFTPRGRSILIEWGSLMAPTNDEIDLLTHDRKALKFQELCKLHLADVSETRSYGNWNPEEELVISPPNNRGVRYAVRKPSSPTSSSPRGTVSDETSAHLANIQSLVEKHQAELESLKGQIELSRHALRPLQQDLHATQKRNSAQREVILSLQNQLAESQAVLKDLPATLSSLNSMQADIARLKAELPEFRTTGLPGKDKTEQTTAKGQQFSETNIMRKHLALNREHHDNSQMVAGDFAAPDGLSRPLIRKLEQPDREPYEFRSVYRPTFLVNSERVPSPEDAPEPEPEPEVNCLPTAHGDGSEYLYDVHSAIEQSLAQGARMSSADSRYRFDLSNIGRAIPDGKNSISTSSEAGEDEQEKTDNQVPRIRPQYVK